MDNRPKILIVDDEPYNVDYLVQELEDLDYTTISASDGLEAMAQTATESPDLILLDMMMPRMDGREVLRRLKSNPTLRHIPVIVISALNDIDTVVHCIEMGAEDYLPKPFNPLLLRARLDNSLQKKKLRDLEQAYLRQELMLRQSEKLAALGKLSAGMAHELNNPAAAAVRAADQLRLAVEQLHAANQAIQDISLVRPVYNCLPALRNQHQEPTRHLSAFERSQLENDLENWLDSQHVADSWQLAPLLVPLGYDKQKLAQLAQDFDKVHLPAVLNWLAAASNVYTLLAEIGQGTTRIAELVGVLKMYTFMDRGALQTVDINQGIENTLVLLSNRLSHISVHRDYDATLPHLQAYGSELNQVWTNIIDNAIKAVGQQGELIITTSRQSDWLVVEIQDNGPGIPEEIQPKIFDPFFTTRQPGEGAGLGLSISHNIIAHKHGGQITVRSQPGRTCFQIKLPLQAIVADG
jgi:signal transduction histidine kinase